MASAPRTPDRERSREQYERMSRGYDEHMRFARRLRAEAIERLAPRPGETVLDVGCGTGLSFEPIMERIGSEGHLIGIEPSPDMLAQARAKVERAGWHNVTLINAGAEEAELPEPAHAVLLFFTHDVMRSRAALENVVAPGARVIAAGGKYGPRWAVPMNLAIRREARNFVTTYEGFDRPWTVLAELVPDLDVEQRMMGGAYLARANAPSAPSRASASR